MNHPTPPATPNGLFIGPGGERLDLLRLLLGRVLDHHGRYRASAWYPDVAVWTTPPFDADAPATLGAVLDDFLGRLASTHPYFHPRYAAQMIADPAIPAVLGYLAAMLMNPNNHAYEGGPATTEMELEVIDELLMLAGFEERGRPSGWGHLCSGGSLANLEALWAVRDSRPDGPVVFSRASHYSWKRSATILRIPRALEVEVDARFRMDAGHLESIAARERPMLVVANLGTTGVGAIDPIDEVLRLRDRYGFHLHVDAAYGGYARACLRDPQGGLLPHATVHDRSGMDEYVDRQLRALPAADSVTIDPHKHGLAPYGVGSVLYRDAGLKRPLLNTAPYTYHLSDRPNLGTISLEGSRPGAAAAACWLMHKVLPLDATGYGSILAACLRTARAFHARAAAAPQAHPLHAPDLDILCVVRRPDGGGLESLAAIDGATDRVYRRLSVGTPGRPAAYVSRLAVPGDLAGRIFPRAARDVETLSALRLVFMKHWLADPMAAGILDEMAEAVLGNGGPIEPGTVPGDDRR